MADENPISDTEAHERLVKAAEALGTAPGATSRADTVLSTARRALAMLQLGLVKAMEENTDKIEGVIDQRPDPSRPE
jgi:hypothetical protein